MCEEEIINDNKTKVQKRGMEESNVPRLREEGHVLGQQLLIC